MYLVLREFGEPTSPSCFPIVRIGGQPYLPHQTLPLNCIFRAIPPIHLLLVVPTSNFPVPLLGRDLLAKVGASVSFCSPHLPDPRLSSSPSPPPSHPPYWFQHVIFSVSLQVDLQVWDTQSPSIASTIPLLLSNYRALPGTLSKPSTHSHSRALGDLNLSSLPSQGKKNPTSSYFYYY